MRDEHLLFTELVQRVLNMLPIVRVTVCLVAAIHDHHMLKLELRGLPLHAEYLLEAFPLGVVGLFVHLVITDKPLPMRVGPLHLSSKHLQQVVIGKALLADPDLNSLAISLFSHPALIHYNAISRCWGLNRPNDASSEHLSLHELSVSQILAKLGRSQLFDALLYHTGLVVGE